MKKFFYTLASVLILSGIVSQADAKTVRPSGRIVRETRAITGFQNFEVSEGIEVYATPSDRFSVEVETGANALEYVITEIKQGNVLSIRYKNNVNIRNIDTKVFVSCPEIKNIAVSSSAEFKMTGTFYGTYLSIAASSSSEVEGRIDYEEVTIAASSSADVDLSGEVYKATIAASSSSDVDLGNLMAEDVVATASSSADISVYVTGNLKAVASSGADIEYRGNPKNIDRTVSSGGSIRRDN